MTEIPLWPALLYYAASIGLIFSGAVFWLWIMEAF